MAAEKGSNALSSKKKGLAPGPSTFSLKCQYLVLYNALNAALWLMVLVQTVRTTASQGSRKTYAEVGNLTKWTQSIAILEVVHALFGIVRAPLFTTVMQVYSRLAIVWATVDFFPQIASSPAYSSMLVAYGCTEVVRYSFFALNLLHRVPYFLHWLRYSTFLIFYPLGISSEYILMLKAFKDASSPSWFASGEKASNAAYWLLLFNLLVWPPSAYILITHMLAQRRKVLGKGASKKDS